MGTSLSSTRSVSSGTLGLSAMLGLAFSFGILEMIGGFVKVDCGTGRSYRLGGRGCWKAKMVTLWVVIITSTTHSLAGSQHCCNNKAECPR